jgi:hypothetical protein
MTPKEKAKELVENFRLNVLDYEGSGLNLFKAKQCALIAVEELIKETGKKYWQEVKQEIEKGL